MFTVQFLVAILDTFVPSFVAILDALFATVTRLTVAVILEEYGSPPAKVS